MFLARFCNELMILECLCTWESGSEPEMFDIGHVKTLGTVTSAGWQDWRYRTLLLILLKPNHLSYLWAWEQVGPDVHDGNLCWELGLECHPHWPRGVLQANTPPNPQGITCDCPVTCSRVTSLQGKPVHPHLVHPWLSSSWMPLCKRRQNRFE